MSFVVVRHRAGPAWLHRQAGLRSLQGLDLALLIHTEHEGFVRRIDVQPHTSVSFSTKAGSVDSLKVRTRCGCRPCACQIRWIDAGLSCWAAAIDRRLQCVARGGAACSVASTTCCSRAAASEDGAGGNSEPGQPNDSCRNGVW